jgi:aryl-alcohol dehydrogenase-like predicted oxidoreductase
MSTKATESAAEAMRQYFLLGQTGLRVSPLCLGTMTFGTDWGWGSEESAARAIFDRYVAAGGNFIDTADGYTSGTSEKMLGTFIKDGGHRDQIVLATKFTFCTDPGNPNAGGNGRKNIYRALEGSLKRLQTDYIDLYWLHAWDCLTPVEEVMRTLNDLVQEGKIRYIGFSDTPAWYVARAQTMAELRGWERISALQLEYSLVERNIEREHVPVSRELGIGICPWSPLAGGLLTGKYKRGAGGGEGDGRLEKTKGSGNPVFEKFTERNWKIVDALVAVAQELNRSPAQVALNWITRRPGVVSTIIGATKLPQLEDNLSALDFTIPEALSQKLDQASAPDTVFPYLFFTDSFRDFLSGGAKIKQKPDWY